MTGILARRRVSRYRGAGGGTFGGLYTITIDHTQCGTADVSNYALSVHSTLAGLKTVANGGLVQDATNGYDIAFYSDSGTTTLLDFEIVKWDGTTGEIEAHVRLPTLSHTVDTVLYLGYGNSTITTDQSNRTGVWDASFGAVYHFGKTIGGVAHAGVPNRLLDSTANGGTLSNGASFSTGIAGQIGVALDVSNSTQVLAAAASAANSPTSAFTVEAWARPVALASYRAVLGRSTATVRNYNLQTTPTGKAEIVCTQGASVYRNATSTTTLTTTRFYHLVGTYDGTNLRFYLDGVNEATSAVSGSADNPAGQPLWIGCLDYGGSAVDPWGQYIDEVRVSSVARSSSYITASYNNQKTASTFYTVT